MEDARVKAFRNLKPPCVDLSQVALQYKGKKVTTKALTTSLETVLKTLNAEIKQPNALDSKLAEYVFFPLSHIFRDAKDLPVRVVEIALQCLQILIAYGWREQLSPDLGKQLLILLCFLAGGSATDANVKDVNEELATVAFECLATLFEASRGRILGPSSIQSENIPVLGHSVTVILNGITDSPSAKVRLAALTALDSIIGSVTDNDALKNVFPGVVSSLTKVLSPKSGGRQSLKTLTASLNILAKIICQVLGDDRVVSSDNTEKYPNVFLKKRKEEPESWVTATAGQVKMALANVLPLRYHDRVDVRTALFELCASIIRQCRNSLSQCIPMLMDTMVVLHSQSAESNALSNFDFGRLLAEDTDLMEIVQDSLYDWIVALPRIMQSNDDTPKRRTIEQVSTAFRLLQGHNVSLGILYNSLVVNLRASASVAIQGSSKAINPVSAGSLEVCQMLQATDITPKAASFTPNLFSESSNKTTMAGLQKLAVQLKSLPISTGLQHSIMDSLRTTSGDEQLASLWLSLQLSKDTDSGDSLIDQYLNLAQDTDSQQPFLDDIYAFSLDVLAISTFEDEERWKLQCLALEAVALQARHQGEDFRPELVDALYPILERLGSNSAVLQQHAMTCLNIVSSACNYPNAAALVINNADYLVNVVALKLNTFNISPQVPQVLVVMIRLSGSALIPHLDDVVESIFALLACYHGYPKMVESHFSVLNAIVEEAAKSSTHAIKSSTDSISKPQPYQPLSIPALASLLRSNLAASTRSLSPPPEPTSAPNSPTSPSSPPRTGTPPPPPPSKTTTLLTSIVNLTPSHLTTPSPPLRSSILNLLTTTLPLLAPDTTTFLPLIATLFPAIITRLDDPEAYTALAAANTLRVLCECAGDFLAQRVEEEWGRIVKLYARVEKEMREEKRVMGKVRGMKWRVWDAVVGLVLGVVREVGVSAEMEDGVFEMLGELAGEREDVREVLEGLNPDALWLVEERARIEAGGKALVKPEAADGVEFRDVDISW